jgi:hypothetical protein
MITQVDTTCAIYLVAEGLAKKAAEQFKPSYYVEGFVPHEWAVQAIVEALSSPLTYRQLAVDIVMEQLDGSQPANTPVPA